MKFKVIDLPDGEFAVDASRGKYFGSTKTSNRQDAEDSAVVRSAHWYREKLNECESRLDASDYFERHDCNFGDLMC